MFNCINLPREKEKDLSYNEKFNLNDDNGECINNDILQPITVLDVNNKTLNSPSLLSMVDINLEINDNQNIENLMKQMKIASESHLNLTSSYDSAKVVIYKDTPTNTENFDLVSRYTQTVKNTDKSTDYLSKFLYLKGRVESIDNLTMTILNKSQQIQTKCDLIVGKWTQYIQKVKPILLKSKQITKNDAETNTYDNWLNFISQFGKVTDQMDSLRDRNIVLEDNNAQLSIENQKQYETIELLSRELSEKTKELDETNSEFENVKQLSEFVKVENDALKKQSEEVKQDSDCCLRLQREKLEEIQQIYEAKVFELEEKYEDLYNKWFYEKSARLGQDRLVSLYQPKLQELEQALLSIKYGYNSNDSNSNNNESHHAKDQSQLLESMKMKIIVLETKLLNLEKEKENWQQKQNLQETNSMLSQQLEKYQELWREKYNKMELELCNLSSRNQKYRYCFEAVKGMYLGDENDNENQSYKWNYNNDPNLVLQKIRDTIEELV